MDRKRLFNDALSKLVDMAGRNGNILAKEDIYRVFDGIIDDEEMYSHIYRYLADNKIEVEGFDAGKADRGSNETELEKAFVEMYKKDLSGIHVLAEEEILSLLKEHLSGNDCLQALTEAHLHMVMDIIGDYGNRGLATGDLIQEGNLGLVEGILSYSGEESLDMFRAHIKGSIHNALKAAIDEQSGSERIGKHIADRANALDHAASELAKDLEREPTLKELAEYLSLAEDEVEKIMKMSLDALTIEGEGAIAND